MSDVPNWGDMLIKLLGYVAEELTAANETDDLVIRMRHIDRANVFLREACHVADAHGSPVT